MYRFTRFFLNLAIVIITISYALLSNQSITSNKIIAGLVLLFSAVLLIKCRKTPPLFLIAFFILYCNYSIVVGEYFVGGELGIPLNQVKTVEIYGTAIRALLVFVLPISLFYKTKKIDPESFRVRPINNIVVFSITSLILCYILLFGINRTSDLNSYNVNITPLYEYSLLFFLVAYFTSGALKLRKVFLSFLLVIFVIQDFYYGGRITSLQLIFLFLVTIFLNKISWKTILAGGVLGIFMNSIVGVYRKSYSLEISDVWGIVLGVKKNLFVFDTPVFAFYASATQVAASYQSEVYEKIYSLSSFLLSVFAGSGGAFEAGNVTRYVSNNYYMNYGGGLLPTHFFFWLGWAGVFFSSVAVLVIMNKLGEGKKPLYKLITLVVISTTPRWYLYTPLSLIRPLFLFLVMYLLVMVVHKILVKVSGQSAQKA